MVIYLMIPKVPIMVEKHELYCEMTSEDLKKSQFSVSGGPTPVAGSGP